MKLYKFFITLALLAQQSSALNLIAKDEQNDNFMKPMVQLAEILKDWNAKHPEKTDVVIFNVGENTNRLNEVLKVVSRTNIVIAPDMGKVEDFSQFKMTLAVIIADTYDAVSENIDWHYAIN